MSLYLRFETLSVFIRPYHNIIVTGDFNANLFYPRKNETVILQNLINTNAFSILSTVPIHHLHHTDPPTHSRLDLFLVKHIESVVHFTKSDSLFMIGHEFIHLTLNVTTLDSSPKTITCHNLKIINTEQLQKLMAAPFLPLHLYLLSNTDINLLEHSLTCAQKGLIATNHGRHVSYSIVEILIKSTRAPNSPSNH